MICNQFGESFSSWILKWCVWPVLFLFHLMDPHCLSCCCVTRGCKVLRVQALTVSSVHLRVGWAQRVALLLIQNCAQLRCFSHMCFSSFHYEGTNEHFLLMMAHLCIRGKLLSCVWLFVTLDCSRPGSCPRDSPGKNTGVGLSCPPPGNLPDPGIEPASLVSSALAGGFFTSSATWEAPLMMVIEA